MVDDESAELDKEHPVRRTPDQQKMLLHQKRLIEEGLHKMKKDAIQLKKDLRLKRLSYKKHVQMDDDQELNMIMNYNSSAKQEVSQANSDQKTEESNISLGMPTFYQ